jgi:hypothetical protein
MTPGMCWVGTMAWRAALMFLADPAVEAETRIRRVAVLGAIAAVLLASGLLTDVPEDVVKATLVSLIRQMDRSG